MPVTPVITAVQAPVRTVVPGMLQRGAARASPSSPPALIAVLVPCAAAQAGDA